MYISWFWEQQAAAREWDGGLLWAMSSSKCDRGWAIEVALGDDTTDVLTGGDDSEISPGDGA